MTIDRIDWHYEDAEQLYAQANEVEGEYTEEQYREIELKASNHIGLFIRWIMDRHFEGEECAKDGCDKVRSGEISGAEYLLDYCDGKLWDVDIRSDIMPFVNAYYVESSDFFGDYGETCGFEGEKEAPCYGFISGDGDYNRLKERIDKAYEKFCEGNNG